MEHQEELPIEPISPLFAEAFQLTIGHEGGFQKHYKDRGNWTGGEVGVGALKGTKYGISAASYPHLDIAKLTLAMAQEIYRQDYWDKIRGDEMPRGLGYAVFDFAVHSGVARAVISLQGQMSINPNFRRVAADGVVGPITLASLNGPPKQAHPLNLADAFVSDRLRYLMTLSMWETYEGGWSRRIEEHRLEVFDLIQQGVLL